MPVLAQWAGLSHSLRMLTLIIGTNRPGSNSRKVAMQMVQIYTGLGAAPRVLDLADLPPEVFSPGSYAEKPAAFRPYSEAVVQSTGLIVVTPEYNGSPPGVLKYFIDLLPFPESFERRPVCFVGLSAGQWGGLRPVEHLQAIFGYRNAFLYPERVFLPGISGLLDEGGRFRDPEVATRLERQAAGFIEFVERLTGVRLRRSAGSIERSPVP